jgi:hypothetical protein
VDLKKLLHWLFSTYNLNVVVIILTMNGKTPEKKVGAGCKNTYLLSDMLVSADGQGCS